MSAIHRFRLHSTGERESGILGIVRLAEFLQDADGFAPSSPSGSDEQQRRIATSPFGVRRSGNRMIRVSFDIKGHIHETSKLST
jgi:hypothetical protein